MTVSNSLLLLLLAASGSVAAGSTGPMQDEGAVAIPRAGAVCKANRKAQESGETHRCFFTPKAFGARDFSTANGRAFFVFSELGHACKDIEILSDAPYAGAEDTQPVQRVGVSCLR
jgi:hypothetical protein